VLFLKPLGLSGVVSFLCVVLPRSISPVLDNEHCLFFDRHFIPDDAISLLGMKKTRKVFVAMAV
jgi:hypothetical protein